MKNKEIVDKSSFVPKIGDWVIALTDLGSGMECDSLLKVNFVDEENGEFRFTYFAELDDDLDSETNCVGEDRMLLAQILRIENDPAKIVEWEGWLKDAMLH